MNHDRQIDLLPSVMPLELAVSFDVMGLPRFESPLAERGEARFSTIRRGFVGLARWKCACRPKAGSSPPRRSTCRRDRPARTSQRELTRVTTRAAASHERTVALPPKVRPKPTADTVLFKDRLLYLLQPPIDHLIGRNGRVPFQPFPYQLEGIAFLMPRHARPARRRDGPGQDGAGDPRHAAAVPRRRDPPCAGRLPQAAGHQLVARTASMWAADCRSR